jgi:hypothetical protein
MVSPVTMATAPKPCASGWEFIETNCELTWQGITLYGTIDAGGGWQNHGAPLDPRSAPGASYLIEKMNRSSRWTLAPNALSTSTIGIKGTEPIGGNISLILRVEASINSNPGAQSLHLCLVGCADISALIQVTPAVRHDATATGRILKAPSPPIYWSSSQPSSTL